MDLEKKRDRTKGEILFCNTNSPTNIYVFTVIIWLSNAIMFHILISQKTRTSVFREAVMILVLRIQEFWKLLLFRWNSTAEQVP